MYLIKKCLYKLLYNKPVDYIQFKSFGYLSFFSNTDHTSNKLAPREVPCVFIGYPPTQKGHRLLDLNTMKPFISRDVTFNELVFSLNSFTPKPYMLPLPIIMPSAQP